MSVPALPQSIGASGARIPPSPTPWTRTTSSPSSPTSTPSARTAAMVDSVSAERPKPLISVSPSHTAPMRTARCDSDLSPGTPRCPTRAVTGSMRMGTFESRVDPTRGCGSRDNLAMRIFSGIQPTGAKTSGTTPGASASTPRRRSRARRSSASSTSTRSASRTTPETCASARSTCSRCSLRRASTRTARRSSRRAT